MEGKNVLVKLGFLESENRVYLALLDIGPSSVGNIAKKSKLNRVSVYKALENLILNGLVSYKIGSNKKIYEACNPSNLNEIVSEKQQELKNINLGIETLVSKFSQNNKRFETNIYIGPKGAKTIWDILLKESTEKDTWHILGAPNSAKKFGGYFKDFNKKRINKDVELKIIYNKDAVQLIKSKHNLLLTEVKIFDEEIVTPTSFEIIGDNVLLVIYEPEMMIFHIKNEETSRSFLNYFNMIWNSI